MALAKIGNPLNVQEKTSGTKDNSISTVGMWSWNATTVVN